MSPAPVISCEEPLTAGRVRKTGNPREATRAEFLKNMESQELAVRMPDYPLRAGDELTEIVRRAKAGDLAAFNQILLRYERMVLQTAWRLLGNAADAQDAAQEVFLRLYRHLDRLDQARDFPAWLYRVTVNACRDLHRRRSRDTQAGELESLPSADLDPQQALAAGERRRLLAAALRRLSEKERTALVLRDLEGLSTREVAAILRSSESTVRSQISAARVKLARILRRSS